MVIIRALAIINKNAATGGNGRRGEGWSIFYIYIYISAILLSFRIRVEKKINPHSDIVRRTRSEIVSTMQSIEYVSFNE